MQKESILKNGEDFTSDHSEHNCTQSETGQAKSNRELPALTSEQQKLVAENIGLVGVHLRTRVPTPRNPMRNREYDDLFQEGCMSLIRTATRYDPSQHGPFAAYALLRIRGAIHSALLQKFSTIRIPLRSINQAKRAAENHLTPIDGAVESLTDKLLATIQMETPQETTAETIRHAIRRRFERAVRNALNDLRKQQWQRRNPLPIMERIAEERLMISNPSEQTPLRQIARESHVSSSRANAYEKQLTKAVRQHFENDAQLPMLMQFAHKDPTGSEGIVDPERRKLLLQAEIDAFETRFDGMERSARAKLLYSLIERSTEVITEVARNLYQLTLSEESEPLPVYP